MERRLRLVLRCFCTLPLVTGLADILTGVAPLVAAGARIASTTAADPTLVSQVGFWGAIWFGYGASLWWAAGDVRGRATPVRIAIAVLFLSGLARALAWARFGAPAAPLVGAAILELVGSPLVWVWHRQIVLGQAKVPEVAVAARADEDVRDRSHLSPLFKLPGPPLTAMSAIPRRSANISRSSQRM